MLQKSAQNGSLLYNLIKTVIVAVDNLGKFVIMIEAQIGTLKECLTFSLHIISVTYVNN